MMSLKGQIVILFLIAYLNKNHLIAANLVLCKNEPLPNLWWYEKKKKNIFVIFLYYSSNSFN